MPIFGVLSFDYFILLKKLWAKIRYFKMMRENNYELTGLKLVRNQIIHKLDDIFQS